ncbi:fungal-specific transcription factor domain-containing protein [Aspergillus heterothallicus]
MNSSRSKVRKYDFACLECRRRKVKCDGRRPTCVNCTRTKATCHYRDQSVFVVRLADELQVYKARVEELESQIEELAIMDSASRDNRLAEIVAHLGQRRSDDQPSGEFASPGVEHEAQVLSDEISFDGGAQFSVDVDGRQQYFGATSRFHALSDSRAPLADEPTSNGPQIQEMQSYHKKWLVSNARFQDSWERMAYSNIQAYTDADPVTCTNLLKVYWAWQAPLHNYVYRRLFFRDMALGGPYFSKFLFNTILAHACRHMPENDPRFALFERGETFLQQAMLLLIDEMKQNKPRIPTIQGLLILGGRQCAVGKSSEGWLYTGMAIRMITDLGLHLKRDKASMLNMEPDDLEVRKRLYLSVYAWDKSISLCLGRPPSLTDMPFTSFTLLDLSDDEDLWQPPHLLETDRFYSDTKCHSTVTFHYFCNLADIINESYNTVYSEDVRNINPAAIFNLEKKLHSFHEQLPGFLRVDDAENLQTCVPPHILCLNILYHTMLILIFRPFFTWRWHSKLRDHPLALRAQQVCTDQTIAVNELFRTYGRLFAFQYQSYLVSYCVYTAATIDVRLMQHDDKAVAEMAAGRLTITLQMLETEVKQTPGIKRSIEIIRSHLGPQWASEAPGSHGTVPGGIRGWNGDQGNAGSVSEGIQHLLHTPVSSSEEQNIYNPSMSAGGTESLNSVLLQGMHRSVNPELQLESDSAFLSWNLDDFGGGFVPDMAYWTSLQ